MLFAFCGGLGKELFFSLRKTSLSFLRCIGCRVCLSVNLCDVTSGEAESVLCCGTESTLSELLTW